MAAKGATSSLNKGRRGWYRVTATSLLVAAAMLLLQLSLAATARCQREMSKNGRVFVREAEHVKSTSSASRELAQLASCNTLSQQAAAKRALARVLAAHGAHGILHGDYL